MSSPFKQIGFDAQEFTYAMPNGMSERAPLEFWVAAILETMPIEQRALVLKYVDLIKSNQIQIQASDGVVMRVSRIS